ncbi:MAG: YeaH/YhbH family protein [Candidatus Tectimicrobiota bacterium]
MAPPWELRRRGLKDSLRHDQRVKDAIRKNLRELIAEEAIITSDGNRRIKIPLRYLDQYRFKYGQPPQGVGQGEGQPGDVISRQGQGTPGKTPGDGPPGEQPGELTYEVEVPLDELARMMLEDLALPWMEEKPEYQITTSTHQHTDIRRRGSLANLDKRRTLLANIKRNASRGGVAEVGNIHQDDLRYKVWEMHEEHHANAAVYMLMDRSGSMTANKKYIAKSFFFWMVRFLQLKYQHVETVFIAHDSEAHVVPEQDFFALTNDGGTLCSSAYKMALEHVQQHYPASRWNIYLFHFSDGDNLPYDNAVCKTLVEELLLLCTMVGYGEIRYQDEASFYGWMQQPQFALSSLQHTLKAISHPRLLSATITHKDELYQVLRSLLQPQEKANV